MLQRTKEETLQTPIFLVGALRSGTTVFRLLLDHHPSINMFGELEGVISEAEGDQWPDIDKYHEFLKHDRMMQELDFEVDESLSYEQLAHSFLEQAYERNPKPFIGVSPHSRIDLLPNLWPEAKFIHLLRDPRDVARSCIGMGWVGNVHEGAKYWIQTELRWDILRSKISEENYLTIYYEDLVKDPVACLTKICHFLGLEYDPAMLDIDSDTTYSRPDPKLAEQWKRKQSEEEISWVEYQCADLMKDRGYQPHVVPTRKPSSLKLAKLKIHSHWFRIKRNIKQWGFTTWFLFVVSKRTGPKSLKHSMQHRINEITRQYIK